MLNIDLIDNLYEGLTKERKDELIVKLFKSSKQNMNYFRRTKDISMSKLEILADYFHLPLEYFRVKSNFKCNKNGSNTYVDNVSVDTNLLIENESLRKEVESFKREIASKDKLIESNEKLIHSLEIRLGEA